MTVFGYIPRISTIIPLLIDNNLKNIIKHTRSYLAIRTTGEILQIRKHTG